VVPHAVFFTLLAVLALVASVLLWLLDASAVKVEDAARQPSSVI